MRTIPAAVACVLVAFGAAFLVTRAVDQGGAARAAAEIRLPPLPAAVVPARSDPGLAAQFTPQRVTLRTPPAKPRRKPQPAAPAVAASAPAAGAPAAVAPAPTTPVSPPVYATPAPAPAAPVVSAAPATHHASHHSSDSGYGTTIIGG